MPQTLKDPIINLLDSFPAWESASITMLDYLIWNVFYVKNLSHDEISILLKLGVSTIYKRLEKSGLPEKPVSL